MNKKMNHSSGDDTFRMEFAYQKMPFFGSRQGFELFEKGKSQKF
jgi:hypothetical protein